MITTPYRSNRNADKRNNLYSMKARPFYLFLTVLFFLTFSIGCWRGEEPVVLNFYCSETFWHVMQEETKAFQQIYGVHTVLIPISLPEQNDPPQSNQQSSDTSTNNTSTKMPPLWKNRPKNQNHFQSGNIVLDPKIESLIEKLSDSRHGDVYLTDSSLEIDRLKSFLLVTHEYPFCFLTMTLYVPKGNPLQIYSVHDVFEKQLQLGITSPSKDGSGYVAWSILSDSSDDSKKINIQEELIRQFDRQYDLWDALENEEIDAALVWDAANLKTYLRTKYADEYYKRYKIRFDEAKKKWDTNEIIRLIDEMYEELYKEKDFVEKISLSGTSLSEENSKKQNETILGKEHRVIRISLISLSTTLHDKQIRRFSDFLISNQGRKILQKHGFTPNLL
ncbi:MAG: substrate-binding domain-containing protein [Planctomycetaceae bacterium]|jgi:ABC-type molybdate transport system substrate-binding protein|nr:substrate-binding domain-containing protein [Planctomycetaceae bacterium]